MDAVRVYTATVDPTNMAGGLAGNFQVSLPGVRPGDAVIPLAPSDLEAGLIPIGCSGIGVIKDEVTLRILNHTAGTLDGAAKTWTFLVFAGLGGAAASDYQLAGMGVKH